MPRAARLRSKTGIYHVMLRGNERKNIFIDDEDKAKFLELLLRKKDGGNYLLYAFCLMDNHVHLVIKENRLNISDLMRSVGTAYAYFFNQKYQRVGHVFQDRYKSENIEEESYLLSVIRYIHQNPANAGVSSLETYPWSSYRYYISRNLSILPEVQEILELFSRDMAAAAADFQDFHHSEDLNNKYLDIDSGRLPMNQEEVGGYIEKYLRDHNLTKQDIQRREYIAERNQLLRCLARDSGWSMRKIADITGINREVVRKALKQ
ncbi:MAG TPA: transposase [Methylomusa anaerophila]|uniref:Transposase IS200 like protein n=1 Tax=Methylomusa anaerophila TaxID=1930071 RepID=A0A348AHF4_9FIRM|nr:transposase [Methylomusa anaerophila]BBB90502.1 transposase IS200 like protein [Methylomusa anaerophila]HML89857.1 transposase [Methylomusa anaerophila]